MLTKELRETQVAIELPAREMLALFNWSRVNVNQNNYSFQGGLLNISGGQVNSATVIVGQF